MTKYDAMLRSVCDYFGADNTVESLTRRVYKDTACGAWVRIDHEAPSVQFGSIVEGSDVEIEADPLVWPFSHDDIREAVDWIEGEAAAAWSEAIEDPRTKGDDDGQEYGDPRDYRDGKE